MIRVGRLHKGFTKVNKIIEIQLYNIIKNNILINLEIINKKSAFTLDRIRRVWKSNIWK